MSPDSPDISIPSEVLHSWQRIVNLLAQIIQVPSAVITQLAPDHAFYRTVAANDSISNPFPVDQCFSMAIGTFCETVIKSGTPLLVANALQEAQWQSAPEVGVGMISYLGLPVLWPDGRMFGTICVLDDKTNAYNALYQELLLHCRDVLQGDLQTLARLGEELAEQRAHLTELFARVPAAVVMVDREARMTRVNPGFSRIFGYTEREALGQHLRDLITPEDRREELETITSRMAHGGDVFALETVRCHKDGTPIPVALIGVPLAASGPAAAGFIIYRDVSDTKRLHDEQRRYHALQLQLAHANRIATLGQLSASIAHELNQPLTGIMTNSGTCLRLLTGEPVHLDAAREAVRRTIRDGTRAADVIARLRALFSHQEPASEPVDLNEATREVIALLAGEFAVGGVIVRTELTDDLQAVIADRVQLQQVVLNLLRNALDAMNTVDDRPRHLVIKTEREAGDRVRLSVTDTGVGFDPRMSDTLFEAFYSTKRDGMGVGLSVSRFILEQHQGRLWAALNDGPGATFSLSMPCRSHTQR